VGQLGQRYELMTARAEFVDSGGTPSPHVAVPDVVLASWRRSLERGVSPVSVENVFYSDLETDSRLVWCAAPVIEQLAEQIADSPMCIALSDSDARILARHDGSSSFARATDRVNFAQGFGYAEGAVGTNGVGTVLESGESVQITGPEHYADSLHTFACTGAPVRDPFTRRIEGVLDISCFADHSTPILHSLVRTAARQIEQNLVAERSRGQHALFEAYTRVEARSRGAVVAVGPRVSIATALAEAMFGPGDSVALQDHVRFRTDAGRTIDDLVDLPSGRRVRVRGSVVSAGEEVAGMVCVLTPLDPARPEPRLAVPSLTGTAPTRTVGSGTPSMRAAARTVTTALAQDAPVLVLGEPGSGRTSLLRAQFEQLSPDGEVVLCPPDRTADPERLASLLTAQREVPTLVVLQDLDRLGPLDVRLARRLTQALSLERSCSLAATASSAPDPGRIAGFAASTTIPPLRHRTADLPTLTAALLAELAPHRDVRLSPQAQRIVAGFHWPGNVTQLRDTLAAALRRRPAGVVEAADLPAYCQSAPRSTLRGVDRAERDAIVEALREHDGNRKAAAEALGLARSTLYRKLRAYGITG
jgi:sigma-54 dependent transcriptional regulator, acetoin dehydrogenase operon transcriptional activator AcoR